MISFSCPGCIKKFNVSDDKAGKKSRCPACGQAIVVPTPTPREKSTLNPLPADRREVPSPGPARTEPATLGNVEAPPLREREVRLPTPPTRPTSSPEVQPSGEEDALMIGGPTSPPQPVDARKVSEE